MQCAGCSRISLRIAGHSWGDLLIYSKLPPLFLSPFLFSSSSSCSRSRDCLRLWSVSRTTSSPATPQYVAHCRSLFLQQKEVKKPSCISVFILTLPKFFLPILEPNRFLLKGLATCVLHVACRRESRTVISSRLKWWRPTSACSPDREPSLDPLTTIVPCSPIDSLPHEKWTISVPTLITWVHNKHMNGPLGVIPRPLHNQCAALEKEPKFTTMICMRVFAKCSYV